MNRLLFIFFLLLLCKLSFATHNRGGRIEVDQISIQTFKITIYTYTKTSSSAADRLSLDSVHLGDGSIQTFIRNSFTDLSNDVRLNIYIDVHTYPASGFYKVHFTDPNRNSNIINIPNSVNVPFHLETEFYADPIHCPYNSAHLLSLPIFIYPMHKDFNLSRAAFDPNWDSLSYEIDTCLTVDGAPVAGYSIPVGVNVNPISGEFTWIGDSMNVMGEYNFAIKIIKWRNGNYYGFVLEDFQVILYATTDNVFDFNTSLYPPNFTSTILPGNQFNLSVEYSNDTTFTPVQFYSEIANQSSFISSTGVFTWTPTTADIRDPHIFCSSVEKRI